MASRGTRALATAGAVLLAALALSVPALAQKTAVDPNTLAKPEPARVADERLDQKITYESLDKRLHSVLDDLTAKSGVTIRCGDGSRDWQVRDLPIVVCARDLPLGRLLDAIAACTHLALTSYDSDGVRVYRIWRDRASKKELEDYRAAVRDFPAKRGAAFKAVQQWQWDTWVKLGQSPGIDTPAGRVGGDPEGVIYPALAGFAKIVGKLSPDAAGKAHQPGGLTLKMADQPPTVVAAFLKLCRTQLRDRWKMYTRMQAEEPDYLQSTFPNGEPPSTVSEAELRKMELVIGAKDWVEANLKGSGGLEFKIPTDYLVRDWARRYVKDWPDPPDIPKPPVPPEGPCDKSFAEPDWESPMMKAEMKIEKPKDDRPLFFADGLALISNASKTSIVCEDFVSHRHRNADLSAGFFSQAALAGVLCSLPRGEEWRNDMPFTIAWRVDAPNKLIVGSATQWPKRHGDLAPERVIANLHGKINSGSAAELDDVLPVACLTPGQREDWITNSRDLHVAHCEVWPDWLPLWRFYDSLGRHGKALAKSAVGLKLSKFDPGKLAALFSETATVVADPARARPDASPALIFAFRLLREDYELAQRVQAWYESRPKQPQADGTGWMEQQEQLLAEATVEFPELALPVIPTDVAAILGLTLRIVRRDTPPFVRVYKDSQYSEGKEWQIETGPEGIDRHCYDMLIEGPGTSLRIPGPHIAFPVYSAEREKKLWEEKRKATAKTTK